METPRGGLSFHLAVAFACIKSTPKGDLEQVRDIFRKYGLEKKKSKE